MFRFAWSWILWKTGVRIFWKIRTALSLFLIWIGNYASLFIKWNPLHFLCPMVTWKVTYVLRAAEKCLIFLGKRLLVVYGLVNFGRIILFALHFSLPISDTIFATCAVTLAIILHIYIIVSILIIQGLEAFSTIRRLVFTTFKIVWRATLYLLIIFLRYRMFVSLTKDSAVINCCWQRRCILW